MHFLNSNNNMPQTMFNKENGSNPCLEEITFQGGKTQTKSIINK